jgi:hypothetical protein
MAIYAAKTRTKSVEHMRNAHRINSDGPIKIDDDAQSTVVEQQQQAAISSPRHGVVTQVDVMAFRRALIHWIILAHIALSCVEQEAFRALIGLLNPVILQYLFRAGNSIRKLIMEDFQQRRERVKEDLRAARSRIHISFDLWTSPNSMAMNGVIAHYLTKDLIARSLLIGLRRVEGTHSGENIAITVIQVLKDFEIEQKIGYFVTDNADNNNTCVAEICKQIGLSRPKTRRLRCFGHIINLAAKAFLFGDFDQVFDLDIDDAHSVKLEICHEKELLAFWRKRGAIGKLHNLVIWIRKTPQRRQAFMKLGQGEEEITRCKLIYMLYF